MASKISILLFILIATGCASVPKPIQQAPIVSQCPVPGSINRPDLPIDHLQNDSTPDEVVLAAKLSIKILQKWGLQLEAILDGYRVLQPK
jgi:hypothetical protein